MPAPANAPLAEYFGIFPQSSEEKIFRELAETAIACVRADEGSILIYDERANELIFALTAGSTSSEDALRGQRVPLGQGITGLAAATRQPQIGAPVYRDVKQSELRADSPNSVMAAPMLLGEHLIGVITAVSFKPDKTFGTVDARILQRIANTAALVVDLRNRLSLVSQSPEHASAGVLGRVGQAERQIADRAVALAEGDPGRVARIVDLLDAIRGILPASKR